MMTNYYQKIIFANYYFETKKTREKQINIINKIHIIIIIIRYKIKTVFIFLFSFTHYDFYDDD